MVLVAKTSLNGLMIDAFLWNWENLIPISDSPVAALSSVVYARM